MVGCVVGADGRMGVVDGLLVVVGVGLGARVVEGVVGRAVVVVLTVVGIVGRLVVDDTFGGCCIGTFGGVGFAVPMEAGSTVLGVGRGGKIVDIVVPGLLVVVGLVVIELGLEVVGMGPETGGLLEVELESDSDDGGLGVLGL